MVTVNQKPPPKVVDSTIDRKKKKIHEGEAQKSENLTNCEIMNLKRSS
jgi:hypothetical protein